MRRSRSPAIVRMGSRIWSHRWRRVRSGLAFRRQRGFALRVGGVNAKCSPTNGVGWQERREPNKVYRAGPPLRHRERADDQPEPAARTAVLAHGDSRARPSSSAGMSALVEFHSTRSASKLDRAADIDPNSALIQSWIRSLASTAPLLRSPDRGKVAIRSDDGGSSSGTAEPTRRRLEGLTVS